MNPPVSLETAVACLLTGLVPLPGESIPVRDAAGRCPVHPCFAAIEVPSFDNSAMDGYAVRSADLKQLPARLRLVGISAAGVSDPGTVLTGTAIRIFTGAPLPPGADAVVMQEDVKPDPDGLHIQVLEPVAPWENVRFRGSHGWRWT